MNSGELYTLFRGDIGDEVAPYLWTDTEVYLYMNDAYRMFARNTGGIADATSAVTKIALVAGEEHAEVDPSILRFRQAKLRSTGAEVKVINEEDEPAMLRNIAGTVKYMVIGAERNKVRWLNIPQVSDIVDITVYRLPLDVLLEGNEAFTFPDIGAEHVEHLTLHMKARAYGKQDADSFDKSKRDHNKNLFEEYCLKAKAEWERYKHKTRSVAYGGI